MRRCIISGSSVRMPMYNLANDILLKFLRSTVDVREVALEVRIE